MNYFADKAPSLAMMGYHPVPILPMTKKPMVSDWPHYELALGDPQKFATASVGILTGMDGLVVVDADIYDPIVAARMHGQCLANLGFTLERIGAPPKFAMLFRMDPALITGKISSPSYVHPSQPATKASRIEILGRHNYLVTHGIHPDTHAEYRWPVQDLAVVPLEKLPIIAPDMIATLFDIFEATCRKAGMVAQRASREIAQEHRPSRRGQRAVDADRVLALLATIDNSDLPYDEWIRLGMAIKGAMGDAAEGLEAWLDFSSQYQGNDVDTCLGKWDTFHPDAIGAGTIVRMAQIIQQRNALKVFGAIGRQPQPELQPESEPEAPYIMSLAAFDRVVGYPAWLVEGVVRQASTYTVTANPGGGKTTLMTLLAACVQSGKPFANLPVQRGNALYLCADDPRGMLERFKALEQAGYDLGDILVSGDPFSLMDTKMQKRVIARAHAAGGLHLLTIDTMLPYTSSADVDSENDNLQMSRFLSVAREYTKLPGTPTVLILCHPRKNAPNTAEDLVPRGGSAVLGSSDGNIAVWIDGDVITMHHSAKMRGAFDELQFKLLRGVVLASKRDAGGRPVSTVMAEHITGDALQQLQASDAQGRDLVRGWLLSRDKGAWVSVSQVELAINLPARTARRYLAELLELRQVRKQGSARATVYSAVRK